MAATNEEETYIFITEDSIRFIPLEEYHESNLSYYRLLPDYEHYLYFPPSELIFSYNKIEKEISIDFGPEIDLFHLDLIIEAMINLTDTEKLSIHSPLINVTEDVEKKFYVLFYSAIKEYMKNIKYLYITCATQSEYYDHAIDLSQILSSDQHQLEKLDLYTSVSFNNADVETIVGGVMVKKNLKRLMIKSQFNVNHNCLLYFKDLINDNENLRELYIFWNYDNSFDLSNNIKSTHLMYLNALYEKINYLYLYSLLNLTDSDKLAKFDYYQKGWLKNFEQDENMVKLVFFDNYFNNDFDLLKEKFETIHAKILEKIKKVTNYRRTSAPAAGKMINDNKSLIEKQKKHACCNFNYSDDDILKSLRLYDKLKNLLEQSRKIIID